MAKYRTKFKMKVVKKYWESRNSYKYYIPNKILIRRWINDFKKEN